MSESGANIHLHKSCRMYVVCPSRLIFGGGHLDVRLALHRRGCAARAEDFAPEAGWLAHGWFRHSLRREISEHYISMFLCTK